MKKLLPLILILCTATIIFLADFNSADAYSSSPPVGMAGAPADNGGSTCTSCHGGTATQTTGVIFNDIPASGFIGGTTYNFSVTMSGSSAYGFEMTPQSPTSNTGLGTWIAGTGTGVSTKYIRHSAKGTGASKTWTFQWIAPTTATAVTFYGAFNYANNNGNSSGDIIKTSSVNVLANTTGLADVTNAAELIKVFPNPASELLHIASTEEFTKAEIYALDGKLAKELNAVELDSKLVSTIDLESGIYFLKLESAKGIKVLKFSKQ